eukprot:s11822_g1.t1
MEGLNNGDTAWMAMSCALVLFMTPGLAFFYGGLVRDSNIVNTMMMSIISMGLTTITWLVFGFTWSFDEWGAGKGFTYVGFRNLDAVWSGTTMPGMTFAVFQMTLGLNLESRFSVVAYGKNENSGKPNAFGENSQRFKPEEAPTLLTGSGPAASTAEKPTEV